MKFSQAETELNTYALKTGEKAAKRLDVQGEFLNPKSYEHLLRGGLKQGQIVVATKDDFESWQKEISAIDSEFWIANQIYIQATKS